MARVYPQAQPHQLAQASPSSPTSSTTLQREVFTIWMKSLVLNGNGCAVYDSGGRLAYRVDNYGCRRGEEAFLMDSGGRVLFRIRRTKNLLMLGGWEGYKYSASQQEEPAPSFRAKKKQPKIFSGDEACQVTVVNADGRCYRIEGLVCKPAYKITDVVGEVVAEVKRKQTASGVILGEDVLTLVAEPNSDLSLVMALVVLCGMMGHSM
ncbi:hypothetical protein Taro_022997 [Colocasia esculenta]|uniref:Protein LURP-one-related 11 n=1 Tax=Colocasia esculenta TaxID=4460 RepID=A0A843V9K7_COLES|nr:hypothetical protein [Colocasia esculenta]